MDEILDLITAATHNKKSITKIGLLTLPIYTNYGGILQIVALYEYLTSIGKEPILLERYQRESFTHQLGLALVKALPSFMFMSSAAKSAGVAPKRRSLVTRLRHLWLKDRRLRAYELHRPFIHRHLANRSGPLYSSSQMKEAVRDLALDAVIVGSDQVWRSEYQPRGSMGDYFLGFISDSVARKISYGASFGSNSWEYTSLTDRVSKLLADFDFVSVREESGVGICRDALKRQDVYHVLDPTMLVPLSFYETLTNGVPTAKKEKQLLEYILDDSGVYAEMGERVASGMWDCYTVRKLVLDSNTAPLTVPAWLRAFRESDFIITDSFHGVVFSLLFNREFVAILNRGRGADRFISLLGQLNLTNRLVYEVSVEHLENLARTPIDYAAVNARLDALRVNSTAFLRRALG